MQEVCKEAKCTLHMLRPPTRCGDTLRAPRYGGSSLHTKPHTHQICKLPSHNRSPPRGWLLKRAMPTQRNTYAGHLAREAGVDVAVACKMRLGGEHPFKLFGVRVGGDLLY